MSDFRSSTSLTHEFSKRTCWRRPLWVRIPPTPGAPMESPAVSFRLRNARVAISAFSGWAHCGLVLHAMVYGLYPLLEVGTGRSRERACKESQSGKDR